MREFLEHAAKKYYDGEPIISDEQFDVLADVYKFNDYLMNPSSFYHTRAVRSPQHPVTGRKELQLRMKDKRMADAQFKREYEIAINKPMDSKLIAIIKAAKAKRKA